MLIGWIGPQPDKALQAAQLEAINVGECFSCSLDDVLDKCHFGDTLAVWRLDVFSGPDEISRTLKTLNSRGVAFVSVHEGVRIDADSGALVRDLIRDVAKMAAKYQL
ncbi:recombinase family protein [Motilimonas cestriensis]|uniref:Recombinase family protein n=1 Tax=Motilimonas cestriensis TaxID=2742685 RepID=A0ABS8WDQ9_9GAMM|nr:recombinase family protein [Motilimonas cestriensis]MCE2597179.1 recombinase family protein [Motilimonas cestriensis]